MSLMNLRYYFALLAISMILASCSIAPPSNSYQRTDAPVKTVSAPIEELQNSALGALQKKAYQRSIALLQRAIKIAPRDPRSWHLLARSYRDAGDLERCLAMLQRSFRYSTKGSELDDANRKIESDCREQ